LLAKGDQEASVFGSEGFILQYINSLFYENYKINLGAHTIEFEKSGYITNASDILYLETIFGKEFLLNELQNINNRINSKTVIQLFERSQGKLFINKNKTTLVIRQTERIERMYGALLPISYADVLNNFGLRKLVDVIERGATNLN
jgi:hypothetical protein